MDDFEFVEYDDTYKKDSLKITNHAKLRYVERIMGYTKQSDIEKYISNNDDELTKRIKKLCYYSKVIFRGNYRDYGEIKVLNINTWIIIASEKQNKIITMWESDLGFGKELNKKYIEQAKLKMEELSNKLEESIENEKTKSNKIDEEINMLEKEKKDLEERKQLIEERINSLNKIKETNIIETRKIKSEINNTIDNILLKKTRS